MILDFGKKYIAENVLEISMGVLIIIYSASIVSMLVLGLKRQSQKRKLRNLSKAIAELKQLANASKFIKSESEVSKYADEFAENVVALIKELDQLSIPSPTNTDDQILNVWITYLDMLLPLALTGDIYEARLIIDRMEGNLKGNFWSLFRR